MDFWYEVEVVAPEVLPGQRLHVLFEGLDVFATVFVNGVCVGSHRNMFTPFRVDVTDVVVAGVNVVRVCLGSAVLPPGRDLATPGVVGFGNRVRLHVRKAQSCYGWNAMPRLITVGVWRPVSWVVCEAVEIEDVFVRTVSLADDGSAVVEASVQVRRNHGELVPAECEVVVAGQVARFVVPVGVDGGRVVRRFTVVDAELWWPHDHGGQPLYEWSASLSQGGRVCDERRGRFGVRTVELVQEPDADGGTSFRLDINGRPIFLKGMNWSPADAVYARITDGRYDELLAAARDANINALRVWGGGIYENEHFYDRCDELGIVVTHDFMFACGAYPQDAEFLAECRAEAVFVVRRLRSHPSMVMWFGDNENDQVAVKDLAQPEYRFHSPLSKQLLASVVAEYAPGTPYVPTSPYSPVVDDQNDPTEGDCHVWGHGLAYDSEFYTGQRPRMITEIGHLGMPSQRVIDSFLGPDVPRWPIWREEYLTHGTDSMRLDQDGRYRLIWQSIAAAGWAEPTDLDDLIAKSQLLHANATAFWIETYSAQPQCWGIFLWNLADSWPEMSDAYIAYPFHPKPALDAVRAGYATVNR